MKSSKEIALELLTIERDVDRATTMSQMREISERFEALSKISYSDGFVDTVKNYFRFKSVLKTISAKTVALNGGERSVDNLASRDISTVKELDDEPELPSNAYGMKKEAKVEFRPIDEAVSMEIEKALEEVKEEEALITTKGGDPRLARKEKSPFLDYVHYDKAGDMHVGDYIIEFSRMMPHDFELSGYQHCSVVFERDKEWEEWEKIRNMFRKTEEGTLLYIFTKQDLCKEILGDIQRHKKYKDIRFVFTHRK